MYYMRKLCFLSDPEKGATTASQISDVVLVVLKLDLSVESGNTLVHNVNLIFRVSSNGSSMLF